MPTKPLKPCRHPGCANVTATTYCPEHERLHPKDDSYRRTSHDRGYDVRWRKESKLFLQAHPLCACCKNQGRLTAATVVDHKIPHKGNKVLFWDKGNWQPLCKQCHDKKTASEDGGFGNGGKTYSY